MEQDAINQRLKFLAEKLADSTRAFGLAIGDNTSNTHKYLHGTTRPSPDYLEKVLLRFREVNAHWLLTGEGEPFIADTPVQVREPGSVYQKNKKIVGGQVIGQVGGNAIHHQGTSAGEQAAMQREIDQLRSQLVDKERTIQTQERLIRILEGQQPKP